jgi:hypothetical protein
MEGLKNFCRNIKGTIAKVKDGKELSAEDRDQIVQFYIEVASQASMPKE